MKQSAELKECRLKNLPSNELFDELGLFDIYLHRVGSGVREPATKWFEAVRKTFAHKRPLSNQDSGDLQNLTG